MHFDDPATLAAWTDLGIEEPLAWMRSAPGRFTPYTALAWEREGFGPDDAALWSEVYADPCLARKRRSAGFTDPFDDFD